jgi:hypothetical protein
LQESILKLFAACSIWLLLLSSFVQANVVWDKEINEFKTSFSIEHTNNLYNQTSNQVSDSAGRLSANYKLLKLFEGFGVSLPISLSQKSYLEQSQLNAVSYSVAPNIHFFLTEQTSADLIFNKSKNETLSGQEGAEFVETTASLITLNNDLAKVDLNIGRDHKSQFLNISLSINQSEQGSNGLRLSQNETRAVSATYGHQITEDTHLLANVKLNQGKRSDKQTDLQELGAGFKTQVGGSHKLNFIAGIFKRNGDSSSEGHYWVVTDNWIISEQNQIDISTSQDSKISFANDTLTQLNTDYQLNWLHQLSKTHLLSLVLQKQKKEFEQTFREYNKDLVSLSWSWRVITGMQLKSNLQFHKITDSQVSAKNKKIKIDEINLNMELAYTW